jgi:hypothetical protein
MNGSSKTSIINYMISRKGSGYFYDGVMAHVEVEK